MSFDESKTNGTGLSASHIGRENLRVLAAAANAAAPAPFVEPAPPAPGGVALWVTPGDPAVDPAAGALLAIYTDEMGTVQRKVLAQPLVGPGPIIVVP